MMLLVVTSRRKKSPRKSSVASGRARDTSGLFLSSNGHRKSTGRYVGVPGLPALPDLSSLTRATNDLTSSAYAQLSTIHDEKLRLDMVSTKRDARFALREAEERRAEQIERLDEVKARGEKSAAKLIAQQAEKITDERARFAKEQFKKERAAEKRAAEQRDRMEKQQLAAAAAQADKNIKAAEEWAKTVSTLNVAPTSPTAPTEQMKLPGM